MSKPITPIEDPNRRLADVIDAEAPAERIIKALADALTADLINRDGTRGPDHRTRKDAAVALLQFRIGKPIERSEIVNVNLDPASAAGIEERLKNSPAMRQSLRKLLDAADSAEAADAPPVDV